MHHDSKAPLDPSPIVPCHPTPTRARLDGIPLQAVFVQSNFQYSKTFAAGPQRINRAWFVCCMRDTNSCVG